MNISINNLTKKSILLRQNLLPTVVKPLNHKCLIVTTTKEPLMNRKRLMVVTTTKEPKNTQQKPLRVTKNRTMTTKNVKNVTRNVKNVIDFSVG